MIPAAWFCPACQKHHAPHCDSCPGQTAAPILPGPYVPPVYTVPAWPPVWDRTPAPWWQNPIISFSGGVTYEADPNIICIN